uniref:N-acetylgalactosaminide beta-1,3-galactosyltransferase n=1 Tax=Plectus sambesii TaxID=2011161 RepID=A0A914XDA0_9BILA
MDETLGIPHATVFANMLDGAAYLWPKTKAAMNFTFIKYRDDFDWFFKADDDTFVIVENLRALLARFDATKPHYLGFRMKPYATHGYNSGGAGYALSRPALKLLVEQLLPNKTLCPNGASEDLQLALCLEKAGILPGDTRDQLGRHTFFPYRPQEHFHGKIPYDGDPKFWYYYVMKTGFEAFSENLITLHHLKPDEIRVIELLVYHLRLPQH